MGQWRSWPCRRCASWCWSAANDNGCRMEQFAVIDAFRQTGVTTIQKLEVVVEVKKLGCSNGYRPATQERKICLRSWARELSSHPCRNGWNSLWHLSQGDKRYVSRISYRIHEPQPHDSFLPGLGLRRDTQGPESTRCGLACGIAASHENSADLLRPIDEASSRAVRFWLGHATSGIRHFYRSDFQPKLLSARMRAETPRVSKYLSRAAISGSGSQRRRGIGAQRTEQAWSAPSARTRTGRSRRLASGYALGAETARSRSRAVTGARLRRSPTAGRTHSSLEPEFNGQGVHLFERVAALQ